MSKLVRLFLLVTIAVLLVQVVAGVITGATGLVQKLVMLGAGVLLLVIATQVELNRDSKAK